MRARRDIERLKYYGLVEERGGKYCWYIHPNLFENYEDYYIKLEHSRQLIPGLEELARAAGKLVSLIEENEFSKMYKEIKKLYGKRNRIVHGGLEVDLSRKEVNDFRKNIKNIILVLIYIDKNKEKIIALLDNCLVDYKNTNEELNELVTSAKVNLYEKGILKK